MSTARAALVPQAAAPAAAKTARAGGLRIGAVNDAFEREADRLADAVMREGHAPQWSFAKTPTASVQRDPTPDAGQGGNANQQQAPKPNNYGEAAGKLGEAFLQTDVGKKLKDAAAQDPLVKGAEDFVSTLPGKIIVGAAATGAVSALAATHTPLPVQIPEIPLDKIQPGLKVKLTYEGPVDHPTKAMVTFSFTPGGDKKKKKEATASQRYLTETAPIAASMDEIRAGMTYAPGTPQAKEQAEQQAAEKKMLDDYAVRRIGALPGTGGVPLIPPPAVTSGATLQRKCACEEGPAGGECEECKKKKSETVQRKAAGAAADVAPPIVDQVLSSAGRPLDKATRDYFEPRFGCDFSRVRVHSDAQAAESARAVNAHAYTVGNHIAFGGGRFDPSGHAGRQLLAHELVHVRQQQGEKGSVVQRQTKPVEVGPPAPDECEGRADITQEFKDFLKALPALLQSAPDFTPEQKVSFQGEIDRFLQTEAGVNVKTFKVISCDKINSELMVGIETASAEVSPDKKEIRLSKNTKKLIDDFKQNKDKASLAKLIETLAHEKRHVTLGAALKVDPKDLSPGRSDTVAQKAEYRAQEILATAEEIAVGRRAFGSSFEVSERKQLKLRRQNNMLHGYVTEAEYKRLRSIIIAKLRERYGFEHGCDNALTVGVISSMDHNRWFECVEGSATGIVPPVASDLHVCDDFCKTQARRPGTKENEEGSDKEPDEASHLQRKCANCGQEEELHRKETSTEATEPAVAPPIVDRVLNSSGRPLDGATRAYFEPRFGHDFSKVRIHSDAQAAESARAVNAHAYTVGDNIAFAAGRYSPQSSEGRRLLAHELAHVVQQNGPPTLTPGMSGKVSAPGTQPRVLRRDDDDNPPNPWDKLSPKIREKTEALFEDCDDRIGEIDMAGLANSPMRAGWANTLRAIRTSIERIDTDSQFQGRENAYFDTFDKISDAVAKYTSEWMALYKNYEDTRRWLTSARIRSTDSIEAAKYLDEIFRDLPRHIPHEFVTEDDYRPQKVAMEKQEYIRIGVLRGARIRAKQLMDMMNTVGDLLRKGEDANKFVPGWNDRVGEEAEYLNTFAQLAEGEGRSYAAELGELRGRLLERQQETAKIKPQTEAWYEKGADLIEGGVEAVAGIFIEAGKEVIDLVQIDIHFYTFGKYEPKFISDMAAAAEQGASTTKLLKGMVTGILETPGRFLQACRDGDWEAIGRESVNLYMLADGIRKAPEIIKKFPEAVKRLPELVAKARESLTILRARTVALGLKMEGRFSVEPVRPPAVEQHPVAAAPSTNPRPAATQPPPPAPIRVKPVESPHVDAGTATKPMTGPDKTSVKGGGQTTKQDPGRLGVVDQDKVRPVTPKKRQQVPPPGDPAPDRAAAQSQKMQRTGTDDLPPAKTVDPHTSAGGTQSAQGGASGTRMGSKSGSSTPTSGSVDAAKGDGPTGAGAKSGTSREKPKLDSDRQAKAADKLRQEKAQQTKAVQDRFSNAEKLNELKKKLPELQGKAKATPAPDSLASEGKELGTIRDLNERLDRLKQIRGSRKNWTKVELDYLDSREALWTAMEEQEAAQFGKSDAEAKKVDADIQVPEAERALGRASQRIADILRIPGKNFQTVSKISFDEIMGQDAFNAMDKRPALGTDHIFAVSKIEEAINHSELPKLHSEASPAIKEQMERDIQSLGDERSNLRRMSKPANEQMKSDRPWSEIGYAEAEKYGYTREMVDKMRGVEIGERKNILGQIEELVKKYRRMVRGK